MPSLGVDRVYWASQHTRMSRMPQDRVGAALQHYSSPLQAYGASNSVLQRRGQPACTKFFGLGSQKTVLVRELALHYRACLGDGGRFVGAQAAGPRRGLGGEAPALLSQHRRRLFVHELVCKVDVDHWTCGVKATCMPLSCMDQAECCCCKGHAL